MRKAFDQDVEGARHRYTRLCLAAMMAATMTLTALMAGCGDDGEDRDETFEEEWHEPFTPLDYFRGFESDIEVQSVAHYFASEGVVVYEVKTINLGPQAVTEGGSTYFTLPATAFDIECEAWGACCAVALTNDNVILIIPPLEPEDEVTYRISFKVDSSACDDPDAYIANVWTRIANIEMDRSNDNYDLAFPDEDGDGVPDVCADLDDESEE